jgi:hypothetical protein
LIEKKIKLALEYIFERHVEFGQNQSNADALTGSGGDRVSVMTYGKNVKKLFNLVSMTKNRTQLRNQIGHLQMTEVGGKNYNNKLQENKQKSEFKSMNTGIQSQAQNRNTDLYEKSKKGNIIKALETAIAEFIDKGATVQKLDSGSLNDENKRVIVIFTS